MSKVALFVACFAFVIYVQASPLPASREASTAIDTLHESGRVKRQGGGCGCCGCGGGCGCCGCGGGGGGCGCCCCKPKCCCRCTTCRTCCCTKCCTCCKPCCCKPCCCGCGGGGGCGCGCCGCGGGRKRRSLQNLRIQLADKIEKEGNQKTSHEENAEVTTQNTVIEQKENHSFA